MKRLALCFLIVLIALSSIVFASDSINVEIGHASADYNKVKIDGEDGTKFNLAPSLESTVYYRLSSIK